jgi:hypothetical protein
MQSCRYIHQLCSSIAPFLKHVIMPKRCSQVEGSHSRLNFGIRSRIQYSNWFSRRSLIQDTILSANELCSLYSMRHTPGACAGQAPTKTSSRLRMLRRDLMNVMWIVKSSSGNQGTRYGPPFHLWQLIAWKVSKIETCLIQTIVVTLNQTRKARLTEISSLSSCDFALGSFSTLQSYCCYLLVHSSLASLLFAGLTIRRSMLTEKGFALNHSRKMTQISNMLRQCHGVGLIFSKMLDQAWSWWRPSS